MTTHALRLIPLLALAAGSDLLAQPVVTGITRIEPLIAGSVAYPLDINNHGEVVGRTFTADYTEVPFRWSAGTGTAVLPLPEGIQSGTARAINNLGVAVGSYYDEEGNEYGAVWPSGSGVPASIGLQAGGYYTFSSAINDAGVVVGSAQIAGGGERLFTWTAAGGVTRLDTLIGNYGQAHDINSRGVVVGYSGDGNGYLRAYVWDGVTMQALPPHPDNVGGDEHFPHPGYSHANAINDHDEVVGVSFGYGGNKPVRWENGEAIDLGSLGHSSGEGGALDINNDGMIVGWSSTPENTGAAFVYVDGVMYSLAELAAPFMSDGESEGFISLVHADAINDLGQIVGYGDYWNGENIGYQGFVITLAAVPEPSSAAALAGLGALGLAALRRRRRA